MRQADWNEVFASVVGLFTGAALILVALYLYWMIRAAQGCAESHDRILADPLWRVIRAILNIVLVVMTRPIDLFHRVTEAGRS